MRGAGVPSPDVAGLETPATFPLVFGLQDLGDHAPSDVTAVLDADRWARETASDVIATFSTAGASGAVAALTGAEAAI